VAAVCVFCASSSTLHQRWLDLATNTGRELAARGHTLVSGGGRVGMMGAVAEGARSGGAHTLGVIPQSLVDLEVADTSADELIVTDDMGSRKDLMIDRSDAFITLPGGIGTLEELFEIWTARTLGMHDKPVVVLDPLGVLAPVRELVDGLVAAGFARPVVQDAVVWTTSVAEALDAVEAAQPATATPTAEEQLEAEPS
jgi:uncharacterized protein (TIGR00730 family)